MNPKPKGRNKAQSADRVKSAFITLKKAQKEVVKAAAKATSSATASSKKASEYDEVLSSFG